MILSSHVCCPTVCFSGASRSEADNARKRNLDDALKDTKKHVESHLSAARCVGRWYLICFVFLPLQLETALTKACTHERPEGMEEASVMMVGLEVDRVMQALAILDTQPRGEKRSLRKVADYSMPNVSDKVVRIIVSYTDYVNRVVWKKY